MYCRAIIFGLVMSTILFTTKASAQWYKSQPTRNSIYSSKIMKEIEDRMPSQHIYRDSDRITWVHETTHGLNSRLRQKYGGTGVINCTYIAGTEGAFVFLKEPPITLQQIAAKIPASLRDGTYQTYLVESRQWWNNEPLYMFDEFSAYYNGTLYGLEVNFADKGHMNSSTKQTIQFLYFSLVVVELTPDSYKEKEKLRSAVNDFGNLVYKNIIQPSVKRKKFTQRQNKIWNMCRDKIQKLALNNKKEKTYEDVRKKP